MENKITQCNFPGGGAIVRRRGLILLEETIQGTSNKSLENKIPKGLSLGEFHSEQLSWEYI